MEIYEVFDHFQNEKNDRSWWPLPSDNLESVPMLTAAVSLSGMMDDCQTESDLADAVDHTFTLVSSGVFTVDQLSQHSIEIEEEVATWMKDMNSNLSFIAGMN